MHTQPRTRDGAEDASLRDIFKFSRWKRVVWCTDCTKQGLFGCPESKSSQVRCTKICAPTEQVRTGSSCRLLPRLCLARAPTTPCTRARCSRRARHARSSRRARARASPRMRATNDVGVPMSPLSLPARLLSALRSTAPCTRARVYRARSSRTHARLTCARAAWRWRARRFGLTSLDVSHVDVAFADTQSDERDDDERDDDERDEQDEREEVPVERVRVRAQKLRDEESESTRS